MGIGLFPPKRHVLVEKAVKIEENIYELEFCDAKYTEIFSVELLSSIQNNINVTYLNSAYQNHNMKSTWEPITIKILKCEGPLNGERLSRWVNSYLFSEYHSLPKACSMRLTKILEGGNYILEWMLHGCIPISVSEENGAVKLVLSINHGVLHFKE